MVPMPGCSRSGIHSSSTTKLISTTAWPSVIGTCRIRPEWSTSHGARPTLPRTIMARLTPYSTRPTTSCGNRRPSRPARSWATGPSSARRAIAGCVVVVMVVMHQ